MDFEIDMKEFKELNSGFLVIKKELIINFLKLQNILPKIVNDNNLVELKVYIGPFKKYGGTMMTGFYDSHFEVFLDESFTQAEYNEISKTHEMLHLLSYIDDEELNYFGHNEDFLGIDEAVTEFLAEMIENNDSECYLSFLVNIIKTLVNIFGIKSIINQYFKISYDFEKEFNKLTNNEFYAFGNNMTKLYHLLRTKEYHKQKWNNEDELELEITKNKMIEYISKLVDQIIEQRNNNESQEKVQK